MLKRTNVTLGNSFTPRLSPLAITKNLSRLSLDSLTNLCILWSQLPQTQPKPSKQQQRDLEITREWLIADFKRFLKDYKASKGRIKRTLIDRLLVDYYNNGLNLLQFAQLDSQLMIEKPLNFFWQSSKIFNSTHNEEEIINLRDPQLFLNHLLAELSKYYLNHIYISNHPYYPLLIIRVQLFDLMSDAPPLSQTKQLSTTDSIVSRKPIFIAIPINSSNVIHSYHQSAPNSTDTAVEIVLQSFETALSNSLDKQLRIIVNDDEPPIRSLESLHILKGNSRFSESLGPWAPYADGTVDISPFDDVKSHSTFTNDKTERVDVEARRIRVAMLRFKGTLKGLKSEKLYEDVTTKTNKKRKLLNDEGAQDPEGEDEERNVDQSEYSSITPIQSVQFDVRNQYKEFQPRVKIKFTGRDVFGGLHELCDRDYMDPETLPGWLTGQESQSHNGVIENDVFIPMAQQKNSATLI